MREFEFGPEGMDVRSEHIDEYIDTITQKVEDEFSEHPDYHPATLGRESGRKLYFLLLKKKPDIVVETGVCNGFSSAVILKALDENQNGRLFSVDLPVSIDEVEEGMGAVIPPGKDSGWVIPDELRDRWTLREGDTYYQLPKVFEDLSGGVDIFLHDSGHSYETMMFEFAIAWRHLKEKGLLLADNIDHSRGFSDFVEAKEVVPYRLGNLGLMKKTRI